MAIAAIGISSLYSSLFSHNSQSQSPIQQLRGEFQQMGQDLQSGNLAQAQQDFATLQQNFQSLSPNAAAAAATAATTTPATATTNPASTVTQAYSQLGQDLQSGNLTQAQQDFTTLQTDLQQQEQTLAQQFQAHRHHHFHPQEIQNSQNAASAQGGINQAFTQLAQYLQQGSLSGAQSAFSTLTADLAQIGGFITNSASATAAQTASTAGGSLNVTA